MVIAREHRAALVTLDRLYRQADGVLARALATEGPGRLSLGFEAVALCRKIDLLLDAAGIEPIGGPLRPRK